MQRNKTKNLLTPFCKQARTIAATVLFCLLTLAAALLISAIEEIPPADLTRDPLQTMHGRFYIGIVSNIGILLWMSAAISCFCCAFVLRTSEKHKVASRFYFLAGGLSLLFTIDDLLMVHEKIWPFITGLPSWIPVIIYGAAAIGIIVSFRRFLSEEFLPLLFLSMLFLGLSEGIDLFFVQSDKTVFIEDSLKLHGIAFWGLGFSRLSIAEMRRAVERR